MTAIDYPPMQKGASFNLDAVKEKIAEAMKPAAVVRVLDQYVMFGKSMLERNNKQKHLPVAVRVSVITMAAMVLALGSADAQDSASFDAAQCAGRLGDSDRELRGRTVHPHGNKRRKHAMAREQRFCGRGRGRRRFHRTEAGARWRESSGSRWNR